MSVAAPGFLFGSFFSASVTPSCRAIFGATLVSSLSSDGSST